MARRHDWHVLIELATVVADGGLAGALEATLAQAHGDGLVADAALAASQAQAQAFWRVREAVVEAEKLAGGSIKHDVSVPISAVPSFIERADAAVRALIPGVRPIPFGHIGDGNIHFNLTQPDGADRAAFLARWDQANRVVHDIAVELKGSFSAEHGIGRMKLAENLHYKAPVEIELMGKIKAALDPRGLMNPGKVVPR